MENKKILKNKAKTELINILDYWLKNTIDKKMAVL
jgi:hypothetical protein